MAAQRRTNIILLIIAVALFLIRWPIDEYTCKRETWHSKVHTRNGELISWLQPFSSNGKNFFSVVFQGGSGTPAIFAMLGGQRELIANIMWNYTDVIWHSNDDRRYGEGNERMLNLVAPMEAAVTLNPYFLEAWSIYGWHMAWNVQSVVGDPVLKARWLEMGENAYIRAVEANPEKPGPYFDLAWLYKERRGDYFSAMLYFRKVVENVDEEGNPLPLDAKGKPLFKPLTPELKKRKWHDPDVIHAKYWAPQKYANQLAYCYKKLAIFALDNEAREYYFDKAIEIYTYSAKLDPDPENAALRNAKEIEQKRHDNKWLQELIASELRRQQQFRMGDGAELNLNMHRCSKECGHIPTKGE